MEERSRLRASLPRLRRAPVRDARLRARRLGPARRPRRSWQNILADVRRGLWVPPTKRKRRGAEEAARSEVPLFGELRQRPRRRARGPGRREDERPRALGARAPAALLRRLDAGRDRRRGDRRIPGVQGEGVRARARAIERGRPQRNDHGQLLRPLSPGSINRTIDFLQWVLSVAIEYKRFELTENAAEGRRRRLRESRPAPVHIDSAAQVEALLEAAAELDRGPRFELTEREAILATLLFAGPRAHELCDLLWRDVDLAGARIFVGRSKTAAGLREIEIRPILRDVLAAHKAAAYRSGPEDLVFPTHDRRSPRPRQPPQPRPRRGAGARRRAARRARPRAATEGPHHPQAAPRIRLDPRGARRGPDLGDAPDRPRRPRPSPCASTPT